MCCILFWTIASPVVGVIAIIVALWIARKSSEESKQQINAVYKLLDVFLAAQAPSMMEAKQKYTQELERLDKQIKEQKEKIEMVRMPPSNTAPIHIADALEEKGEESNKLEELLNKRKETQHQLDLILSYINKTNNNS